MPPRSRRRATQPASFRERATAAPSVRVVPIGTVPAALALKGGAELRGAGLAVEVEAAGRALRKALERAGRLGARWVVLLGEDEVGREAVTVKDLKDGEQREVPRGALAAWLGTRTESA
jgi:histidyl-tRNA synthetase